MIKLSQKLISLFEKQGFVIVSTLDSKGRIHCSAKGIAGIDRRGKIFLIDLYRARTFGNLKDNSTISITAVDERAFVGFTLKGKAKIVERKKIEDYIIKKWEKRVIQRISKRVIKNVKDGRRSSKHPEARFPSPQYLIVMEVKEIVDLTPGHLKKPLVTKR